MDPNPSTNHPLTPMQVFIPNLRIVDKRFISNVVGEAVKEFAISAGARHGDNMMGKLLALDVKTESNKILHLVIKSVLPMTGIIDKNTLSQSKFIAAIKKFPTEICYYEKLRPLLLETVQKQSMDSLNIKLSLFTDPKYISGFSSEDGLQDYIALEDLRPLGYKMCNKNKGLNLEEATNVLQRAALIHATSFYLFQIQQHELLSLQQDTNSSFSRHIWDKIKGENEGQELFNMILVKMVEVLREIDDVGVAAEKLEKYVNVGHQNLIGLWKKTTENGKYFRVFIHGDLYVNNMLFKYTKDGKAVEDVKFVDFQDCRFGNIYEELHYFLFTSTTTEFRCSHLKTCLQNYYQEFSLILKQLKCSLPEGFSEESLISTFNENLEYGFCYNVVAIPFQLGLQPEPPSPMTPLDFAKSSENRFFSNHPNKNENVGEGDNAIVHDGEEFNFLDAIVSLSEALKVAAQNSPLAQKRMLEMIDEMIELDVL